jgi:hypothetical protein
LEAPADYDILRLRMRAKASKWRGDHKTEIVNDVLIVNGTDPVELTPGCIVSPELTIDRHQDRLCLKLMALYILAFSITMTYITMSFYP